VWQGRTRGPGFVLPAVLALIQVLGSTAAERNQPDARVLDWLGYALLLAGPAVLLVRRRWRRLAVIGAVGAAGVYFTLGYPQGPGFLAALVALLGGVRAGYRLTGWLSAGLAYLTWAVAGRLFPEAGLAKPALGPIVLVGAWALLAFAVAEAARVRSAHFAEAMQARAERQRAAAEQQRATDEQQRRQASEERLRIARELHDVIGHHLSLINVQAGVGLHLMDDRPEQARAALTAIKQASAEALREVRSVLGALRPEDEDPPRAPTPGLSGLSALVADVTAAGFAAEIETSGTPCELPAEVDRAAYRIVQEALTNVRRHAGPGVRAAVRVEYAPGAVSVCVADDGASATQQSTVDGQGTGIAGMRQRADALGGEFRAGPREGGGFEVYARLPVPGQEC
jgi:signal transduction histidine kinase